MVTDIGPLLFLTHNVNDNVASLGSANQHMAYELRLQSREASWEHTGKLNKRSVSRSNGYNCTTDCNCLDDKERAGRSADEVLTQSSSCHSNQH